MLWSKNLDRKFLQMALVIDTRASSTVQNGDHEALSQKVEALPCPIAPDVSLPCTGLLRCLTKKDYLKSLKYHWPHSIQRKS